MTLGVIAPSSYLVLACAAVSTLFAYKDAGPFLREQPLLLCGISSMFALSVLQLANLFVSLRTDLSKILLPLALWWSLVYYI